MKKNWMSAVRRGVLMLGTVTAAGVLLISCSKNNNDYVVPDESVAGLMAFNLTTDKSIGITLSGNNLVNNPLAYTNYTGNYLGIYTGTRSVRSFDATSNATLAEDSMSFAENQYYSLFVSGANGTYKNITVRDNFDTLSATNGKAYVRYVNAIPDSAKSTISVKEAGGTAVVNDNNSGFGAVSGFVAVTPGDITIAASNGGTIQTTRTIQVAAPKAYTILIVGVPGSTDTEKAVQVRYIENGSLNGSQQRSSNSSGARMQ